MLEQYLPFVGLIILGIASLCVVSVWLMIGTFGTQLLIEYVSFIEFIGGFAIFVLGLQAMIQSIRGV